MKQLYNICIPYEKDFFLQYEYITKDKQRHILLESGRNARYSIVGMDPIASIVGKNNQCTIITAEEEQAFSGNPLHTLKEYMKKNQVQEKIEGIPFCGGAIGYISYDYARYIENLPNISNDDLEIPDIAFLVFDDVYVYDHEAKSLWLITNFAGDKEAAENHLHEMKQPWMEEIDDIAYEVNASEKAKSVSFTESQFVEAVEKTKEYIAAGDVFQVNLSVRQSETMQAHPMGIYKELRQMNPSPYMAYMEMGDTQVVSSSPELLVKKQGALLSTRPIAGTRSRGKNDAEDTALVNELINHEKERAEHVMLVDLERNDLGRVSRYGTVEVDELMVVEKYSHVMHIVSNVRGEIQSEKDVYDVIAAMFPGGTITGAPKVRTMEIIEELEPVRRGMYTGSIGWIGYNEDTELNITIRTLVAKDGVAHVQAGAGIVIDSIPTNEYKESLKKGAALWKAKERADEKIMRCKQ